MTRIAQVFTWSLCVFHVCQTSSLARRGPLSSPGEGKAQDAFDRADGFCQVESESDDGNQITLRKPGLRTSWKKGGVVALALLALGVGSGGYASENGGFLAHVGLQDSAQQRVKHDGGHTGDEGAIVAVQPWLPPGITPQPHRIPQTVFETQLQQKFDLFGGLNHLISDARRVIAPVAAPLITGTMQTVSGWVNGFANKALSVGKKFVGQKLHEISDVTNIIGDGVSSLQKAERVAYRMMYPPPQPDHRSQPQYPAQQPQYPAQQPQYPAQQPQYPAQQPQYNPAPQPQYTPAIQPQPQYSPPPQPQSNPVPTPAPTHVEDEPVLVPKHLAEPLRRLGNGETPRSSETPANNGRGKGDDDDDDSLPDGVANRQSLFDSFMGISSQFDNYWSYLQDIFCNVDPDERPDTVKVFDANLKTSSMRHISNLPHKFGCKKLARFAKKAMLHLQEHEKHHHLDRDDVMDLFRIVQHGMANAFMMAKATHDSHAKVTLDHSTGRSSHSVGHLKNSKKLVAIATEANRAHKDFVGGNGGNLGRSAFSGGSSSERDAIGHDDSSGELQFQNGADEHRDHFLANAHLVHTAHENMKSRGKIDLEHGENFPGAAACYQRGKSEC